MPFTYTGVDEIEAHGYETLRFKAKDKDQVRLEHEEWRRLNMGGTAMNFSLLMLMPSGNRMVIGIRISVYLERNEEISDEMRMCDC